MINNLAIENIYMFFKNNLYTLDLLLNKKVYEPACFKGLTYACLDYNDITIYFYEDDIQIDFANMSHEIIHNLYNLKYFLYNEYICFNSSKNNRKPKLNHVKYEDINKLKELILEIILQK